MAYIMYGNPKYSLSREEVQETLALLFPPSLLFFPEQLPWHQELVAEEGRHEVIFPNASWLQPIQNLLYDSLVTVVLLHPGPSCQGEPAA